MANKLLNTVLLWTKSIASLFVGRECLVCLCRLRAFESDLCTACLADLPQSYTWIQEVSPADIAFWGRSHIEKVNSLFLYGGNYRKLVHSIKYKGNVRLAQRLGKQLGQIIAEEDIDCIIPVPLHPRKKRQRGYNQSELIARGILKAMKKTNPFIAIKKDLILRRSFTSTQTQKDRIDRWINVRNAFRINAKALNRLKKNLPKDRRPHFLLTDDVLTTGATLDACATILHENLDCKVSIATLAYVP